MLTSRSIPKLQHRPITHARKTDCKSSRARLPIASSAVHKAGPKWNPGLCGPVPEGTIDNDPAQAPCCPNELLQPRSANCVIGEICAKSSVRSKMASLTSSFADDDDVVSSGRGKFHLTRGCPRNRRFKPALAQCSLHPLGHRGVPRDQGMRPVLPNLTI